MEESTKSATEERDCEVEGGLGNVTGRGVVAEASKSRGF